jgi:hypothetical protein
MTYPRPGIYLRRVLELVPERECRCLRRSVVRERVMRWSAIKGEVVLESSCMPLRT